MEATHNAIPSPVPMHKQTVSPMGEQLIVELYGCDPKKINDASTVERVMINAADAANATVVAHKFHTFAPQGVSGAVIVAESHFAIHTWPEHKYCSVDIFTCGVRTNNYAGLEVIKQGFGASHYDIVTVQTRSSGIKEKPLTAAVCVPEHYTVTKEKKDDEKFFYEDFAAFGGARMQITIKEKLLEHQSKLQKIEVYDTIAFGKMLVHDGIIMLTEYDNAAYHEMIAHVPLHAHPNPKKVLIVGGGDGGTLKEVLKHDSVEEVVLCEIDGDVIDIAKQYFPQLATGYDDPRVTVVIQDAAQYIKTKKHYFDVICVDSSDFFGLAESLYRKEFYMDMYAALTDEGIAVTQSESMYYDKGFVTHLVQQNKTIFPIASYYYTLVPTYPSGTIGFSFCSKKYTPEQHLCVERVQRITDCVYYNAEIHVSSFKLPEELKKKI